ncbi:NPCBM/NEW2 domain-containing protein [Parabacteroides sp. FAFU027]|uniref:NPCBM/NEW2 domain-containing protein n=1 Tax=Parabacteroides sp. FAFU027 TaxID=2922715 RepID=UPI001FAEB213|nr:NPCBM/NEW2 domain-containing protein [Parabacteroides sp. FAFU027]
MIKKHLLSGALLACLLSTNTFAQNKSDYHDWAKTPPMGWNSWDCYGPTVVESEVKANADYMSKYMKKYGWEYVIVDIRWYISNDKAHGYNEKDAQYNIDEYGRLTPAVNRFPSAADGKGFKALADYIHSKGLKFGIHIMRGVPIEAVKRNLPIKGSSAKASDIYSKEEQCTWLRDMYTVVPGRNGAQEYYNSILELYASWGVDFIKVDDLSSPIYHQGEIEMIRKAIDRTGRHIVFSTSPGETPIDKAKHVQQHANMWRTVGDYWDSWDQLKEHFDVFHRWAPFIMDGAFPDGDMLPMGRLGIRAERGNDRMSAFTHEEQQLMMSLWCINRSPLMFGGDLPSNDAFTLSMITNPRVLDVMKYSKNNRELYKQNDKVAWAADDTKSKDKYVALFYIADQKQISEEKAVYNSGLITRQTPGQCANINVDIKGKKKLYLIVSGGEDGTSWDHADWINPVLTNGKDSIQLTSLKWKKASCGWGKVSIGKAVSGSDLMVNKVKYANGIGTHANSVIEYDLPEGYDRFSATVGLDNAGAVQNEGGTIKFMVFTENPSGPMPAETSEVSVDLKSLGINGECTVTDLWSGAKLGTFKGKFTQTLKRHAGGLYRISVKK